MKLVFHLSRNIFCRSVILWCCTGFIRPVIMTTLRARKNFLKEGLVRLCAQLRSVVDEETISPSEAAAQFDDLVVRHKEYASVVAELSDLLQGFGEVDRLAKLSREANQIQKDLDVTDREVDEYLMSGRADIFEREIERIPSIRQPIISKETVSKTVNYGLVEQDQDTVVQASEFDRQPSASVTLSAEALQAKQEIEELVAKREASLRKAQSHKDELFASLGITGQPPHERNVGDPVNPDFQVVRERPQANSGSLNMTRGTSFQPRWTSTPAHVVQGRLSNWPTQTGSLGPQGFGAGIGNNQRQFYPLRPDPYERDQLSQHTLSNDLRNMHLTDRLNPSGFPQPSWLDGHDPYRPPDQFRSYREPTRSSQFGGQYPSERQDTHHLSRITLSTFSGDKTKFTSWWSTFLTCVDSTSVSWSVKFLKLKECLKGPAAQLIEGFTHDEASYDTAMKMLFRQYGGVRRALTQQLDELESFKAVKDGELAGMDRFIQLVDRLVLSLLYTGQQAEVDKGVLYFSLQRKLPLRMVTSYNEWLDIHGYTGSVELLREFVERRFSYEDSAVETVCGFPTDRGKKVHGQSQEGKGGRTMLTQEADRKDKKTDNKKKAPMRCKLCKGEHGLWSCEKFKQLGQDKRGKQARELHVCFCCLSAAHRADTCKYNRACGIAGCTRRHHRMLHGAGGNRAMAESGGPEGF